MPAFVETLAPTVEELHTVLLKIITRMMKLLTRRAVLVEEESSTYVADNDPDSEEVRALRPLQAAACVSRIAFGPGAGQKVPKVQGVMPRENDFMQTLCADIDGFSLHAAVPCGADDHQALEQLCRHITRPALANERVQINAVGQGSACSPLQARECESLASSSARGSGRSLATVHGRDRQRRPSAVRHHQIG